MPYNDRRRMTFAAIMNKSDGRPLIWMELGPDGKPCPTRRKTGLGRYVIVSVRQHLATPDPHSKWANAQQRTQLFPTGLHIYTVRNADTGELFHTPALGNGSTVWIVDPAPGKNDPPEPKPEPAPDYPIPSYEWDDVPGYDEVKAKPTYEELEARVAELERKYETPCNGLVNKYDEAGHKTGVVNCGGFLGHPGDCAEVW